MYQFSYFLIRNANCYPNRFAVIFQDQELTYRELNQRANRLANSLSQLGVVKGNRLAFWFRNSIEWVVIWYATQKIGVTAVPLNINLLTDEIARTMNVAECNSLIYHEEFSDKVHEARELCPRLERMICYGDKVPNGEYDLNQLCEQGSDEEAQINLYGEDESMVVFTSGSTGVSKGVLRTQQSVRDYALLLAIENDNCHRPEIFLTHNPLFHTGGFVSILKMAVLCGTIILENNFDPGQILKHIERYRVTQIFTIPPNLYTRLSQYPDWQKHDLSSVREAQCTGGKLSMSLAMTIFDLFPNCRIRPSWGTTEICGSTSVLLSHQDIMENPERIKSVGKLYTMVEIRLVDEQGNNVPDGEVGEALVRSPYVFREYLHMPEKTIQVLQKDGWFHTEDMMKRDQDGYYYLVDRKKDMVKTGGENVYAQEVESVLRDHPAIYDCAIIGVPDAKFGEAVAVAIVLKPGATLKPDELIAYSKANLPSYKKPRYWAIMDRLPTNSIGKIQKNVLRDQAANLFTKIED